MKTLSLPLTRPVVWILLALLPFPFLFSLFQFISTFQRLGELEEEMDRIHIRVLGAQEMERKERSFLEALRHPNPHYLGEHIETLTFLLPEVKKLETILLENPYDEQLARRLQFLKEGGNALLFSEESTRTNALLSEVEEKQQHPVEMNEEDLKKLLCLIEGVTIWPYGPKEGRPQFIIKDFQLFKKAISSQEKVYVVSMQLVKREHLETSP